MTLDLSLGIDLSEHRKNVTNAQLNYLSANGVTWAWHRAARGADYRDPTFPRFNRKGWQLGQVTGAYLFMEKGEGVAQLDNFLHAIRPELLAGRGPDAYILDIEAGGIKLRDVYRWLAAWRRRTPWPLGLYSSSGYLARRGWEDLPELFDYYWTADYRFLVADGVVVEEEGSASRWLKDWDEEPMPKPPDWPELHQYGALKYRWRGKVRAIDGNLFAGSQAQLLRLVRGVHPPA